MLEELYKLEDDFNSAGIGSRYVLENMANLCILKYTEIDSRTAFQYSLEQSRYVIWIEKIAEIQEKYPEYFL